MNTSIICDIKHNISNEIILPSGLTYFVSSTNTSANYIKKITQQKPYKSKAKYSYYLHPYKHKKIKKQTTTTFYN